MVQYYDGYGRFTQQAVFNRMFELRHDVFITGRGWSLPSHFGREIDQYDKQTSSYFIDFADDGSIQGSVRLTPTMKHSLLADYYPFLIEDADTPARGDLIWEATRYIVLPKEKGQNANRAGKARLLSACMEWALDKGLTHLQTVIDTHTFDSFVDISPQTIALGNSHSFGGGYGVRGGGECMAIRVPVLAETIEDIRLFGGLNLDEPYLETHSMAMAS